MIVEDFFSHITNREKEISGKNKNYQNMEKVIQTIFE